MGAAISAHESEGNDVNSDSWLLENLPETVYKDASGDACDSYHRYQQEFAIARSIGLNGYRFGIEWERIEPEQGQFSGAEMTIMRVSSILAARTGCCRSSHTTTLRSCCSSRAGYEYFPAAVGGAIRLAARKTDKPIYVTESGIAAHDDRRRVAWLDACVGEVERCIAEGIDVRSYLYWSLLDNFEWTQGYGQQFGLVSVDRESFVRTPKPSATHFARLIRKRT